LDSFGAIRHHQKLGREEREWGPPGRGGVGGWYDAADHDRRWFHYHAFWDLVLAYELAPGNFTDGQEATHESSNGVPDILDEAAWGLLVWRNSQRETGGVSARLEARAHPSSADMKPNGRPQNDSLRYYFSSPTRESSLRYAGAAAHLARLLRRFDAGAAEGWLDSARRAYAFGADPANHYERADYAGTGKPFREADELVTVSLCTSSLEMYAATKDRKYLETAVDLVLYQALGYLRDADGLARPLAHTRRGLRGRLPLVAAPAREVAVGPVLEAHELLPPAEVHLPDEARGVSRVAERARKRRELGPEDAAVSPRPGASDLAAGEHAEARRRAEGHLAVGVGEDGRARGQRVERRRVDGLAALGLRHVAHEAEAVLVAEEEENVRTCHWAPVPCCPLPDADTDRADGDMAQRSCG
jgi:hypothetical protein